MKNKARKIISLVEKILKMNNVDYKNDPYGPTFGDINKNYEYNPFKKFHIQGQENNKVLPVHDELSKEAKTQFGEDSNGEKQDAVKKYTNTRYVAINGHLRGIRELISDVDKKRIDHLKTLTSNKTKHSFITYRSNKSKVIPEKEGELFKDKGFTSSTLLPSHSVNNFGTGKNSQHLKIHIKPGTRGHYLSSHDFSKGEGYEREFLLHPGTTFRVGKTFKHPNGNTYINLHIHSQEE